MANLIDYTYFNNDINIPLSDVNAQSVITGFITRFENEFLQQLLGYELWKLFIAGISIGNPAQKWLDLKDGKEFSVTFNGVTSLVKWPGLLGGTEKKSVIAYYIYCRYRNNRESFFSGQNQVSSESENSTRIDFTRPMVEVWNEMVNMYGVVGRDLRNEQPGADDIFNPLPSAYNFLLNKKTDYPTWKFTPKYYINEYDI